MPQPEIASVVSVEDGFCPKREDGIHCVCWWDGEPCCGCGAPAMTDEQKRKQGMSND